MRFQNIHTTNVINTIMANHQNSATQNEKASAIQRAKLTTDATKTDQTKYPNNLLPGGPGRLIAQDNPCAARTRIPVISKSPQVGSNEKVYPRGTSAKAINIQNCIKLTLIEKRASVSEIHWPFRLIPFLFRIGGSAGTVRRQFGFTTPAAPLRSGGGRFAG